MVITSFNSFSWFTPVFNTKQKFTTLHYSHLNITKPATPNLCLKLINLRRQPQPPYQNHHISNTNPTNPPQQKKFRNSFIDTNQNTSSDVLHLMDSLDLVVTPDVYASLVNECTRKRNAVHASELFAHMRRNCRMVGFLNRPSGLSLLCRILMMLVVSGCLDAASQLFDEMPHRDSICLAIMVLGFVNDRVFYRALCLFVEMHQCFFYQKTDIALRVVIDCVLECCVHLKNFRLGKMVHGWLVKIGYGEVVFVSTSLVRFYGKFRCFKEANSLFYEQIRLVDNFDRELWTDVIVNNCRGGCFEEVFRIFEEMGKAGVEKNEYIFSSVLKACGRVRDDSHYGRQVHAYTVKLALDSHDLVICGLIGMYGRCGLLSDARKAFDMVDEDHRNSTCWNAIATGFIENGLYIEAIKLLYQMKAAGVQPQESLIVKLRVACGSEKSGVSTGKYMFVDNAEPG